MITVKGTHNSAIIYTDTIDETALEQIQTMCSLEFLKDSKIRIMSDVHAGAGCTIGTTMTIHNAIVPNFVGVDIGKIISLNDFSRYSQNILPPLCLYSCFQNQSVVYFRENRYHLGCQIVAVLVFYQINGFFIFIHTGYGQTLGIYAACNIRKTLAKHGRPAGIQCYI